MPMRTVPITIGHERGSKHGEGGPERHAASCVTTAFLLATRFRTLTHIPPAKEARHRSTVNKIVSAGWYSNFSASATAPISMATTADPPAVAQMSHSKTEGLAPRP